MADGEDVLGQLRRSLARMEARQRASGGTADPGFWGGAAGTPADGSGSGPSRGRRGSMARNVAPRSRPAKSPAGPWAAVRPEALEVLRAAELRWTSEADSEDPGWVAAVAARAEHAHAEEAHTEHAHAEEAQAGTGDDPHAEARGAATGADAAAAAGAYSVGPGDALASGPSDRPVAVTAAALVGMPLHGHGEAELESRGAPAPGGLRRVDWLRSLDPTLSPAAARAFVHVGQALPDPRWAGLAQLVTTQQVTVPAAAQIIEFTQRARPVADPDELDTAVTDLTVQAQALRPEELAVLVRHHTEQIRPPKDDDAADEGRRQARGLWFSPPTPTGMVTLRGVLDPEAAAVIKSAVDPLSAPCPTTDAHGHPLDPDLRTPARRRADALVEIIARGVSAPDGVATTDKAKVVVLIDHDTLTGQVRGTGRTLSGDVLTAEVARRLACDAGIIPVVLGGPSEPLDVGRERRLVTKGLRLALITRDRGCSFPGCTIPPQWTDAHHVTHWARGGHTALTSTALLCRRHHTHVHRHDLHATVTATTVTWHL